MITDCYKTGILLFVTGIASWINVSSDGDYYLYRERRRSEANRYIWFNYPMQLKWLNAKADKQDGIANSFSRLPSVNMFNQ